MKKTIQFLFALSILIEGQSAFAKTNEINVAKEKPILNAPLNSPARGLQVLIILVEDDFGKPVSNATVSAPCTGQGSKLTDATGHVQFGYNGSCNCGDQLAHITTSKGCDTQISLSCTGDNTAVCNQ